MTDNDLHSNDDRPHEGALDIQLALPTTGELPVPVVHARITKRDGHEADFDTSKIADAIFAAAQSIGGSDRSLARSLAASVSLYLGRQRRAHKLHVSDVDDAVERVLVEMGHERTALAYVQHRANHQDDVSARDARSVRDALLEWRWNRTAIPDDSIDASIEQAIRLLGIDPNDTDEIRERAVTISQSIPEHALTPVLIQEVVRATALESLGVGASLPRQFSMNLDALEEAISGTEKNAQSLLTPTASDRQIARRVKEAYGLNALFSGDVSNAHIRGDLHIHALDQVDRLDSITLYPEVVKRFGAMEGWVNGPEPARRIEQLVDDLVETTRLLQEFFAGSIQWEAMNYGLAPYIVEFDDEHMLAVARRLVDGLIDTADTGTTAVVKLHLAWDVPHDLHGLDAIGPNGANTEKPYSEYATTAQQFAHVLLQAIRDAAQDNAQASHVMPVASLPHTPSADASARAYMNRIALCALVLDVIEYECDSERLSLPFQEQPLHPKGILAQTVTLNLPRLGLGVRDGHHFWSSLDQLFDIAVNVFMEKRQFVDALAARKKNGPYSYLTLMLEGHPFAQLDRATVAMNLCGLHECAAAMQTTEEFKDQPLSAIQGRIVTYLSARCQTWTSQSDVVLHLTASTCPDVADRFAGIDATKRGSTTREASYTEGISRVVADGSFRRFERALKDVAYLHTELQGSTPLLRPDPDSAFPEQLSQALEEFFASQPETRLHVRA